MASQLTLSLIEIIVLMLGAITVGITIHYFIVSRRALNASMDETPGGKLNKEISNWKLKYFNDIEQRDKEINDLKLQLAEAEENCSNYSIEAEEKSIKNKKLLEEIELLQNKVPAGEMPEFIDQLELAQNSLLEHNKKINQLLGQISFVKEAEKKQQEMLETQEKLSRQVEELKSLLAQKEKEVSSSNQREIMTSEMTSLLDNAYSEFNTLRDTIQKLERQLIDSKTKNIEYEEYKEGYLKVSDDFEEQKLKYNVLLSEKRQLQADLSQAEEKLIEANFQRQQLQKKMVYLEDLNKDLQVVSEAQKKLEGQLKRIGELETMLNIAAEQRKESADRK
jgi:DNA repair exonuclease SbcCD ATPase subunit